MFGELTPVSGGDPIPLMKDSLRMGRRESCDIVLRFSNVSAHHCMLTVEEGYWFVQDLNSRNGIKVNGQKIPAGIRKRLDPGDKLSVAKHDYLVAYSPVDLGAVGPPPADEMRDPILNKSLLERAGLETRKPSGKAPSPRRYDVNDKDAKMKRPDRRDD